MTVHFYSSRMDYENNNKNCSAYDVLACLQKYDVGTFEDFVSEYGYEVELHDDYIKTRNTYKAVVKEYKDVQRVFSDCLDGLREIE